MVNAPEPDAGNDGPVLFDHAAETALLEACLASKNARIESRRTMTPADFYQPSHEVIYTAMMALDRHGKNVDPVTLRAMLQAQGHPPHVMAGLESVMVRIVAGFGVPEGVTEYASIVHQWALRRRLNDEGRGLAQRALNPAESPERIAAQAVTRLIGVRDAGAGDATARTLAEVMEQEDDEPTWVIPGLFERGDRMMLTGSEGVGKSALSRQIITMAAAGLHPFTNAVIPPIRAYVLDVENKESQVRRQTRPLLDWLRRSGADNPMDRVLVDAIYPRRINLCSDRDLSRIHQTLDAWQPDLVVLGPIYRMAPRGLNGDEEAHEFLAALDTLCERGCALIVEAHAGHSQEGVGKQQVRALRPRGSSQLMGWPEFGLGLRGLGHGLADLEPWRGHREARAWPGRMKRSPGNRWCETSPDERPGDYPPQEEPAADPHGSLV